MRSVILVIGSLFLMQAGCTDVVLKQERTWVLNYREVVKVSTEPSGARVYVQGEYKGMSPIDITLDCGEFRVTQAGERVASYNTKLFSSEPDTFRKWKGETDWNGSLQGETGRGYLSIKAFLDGYSEGTATITCGESDGYRQAVSQLKISYTGELPTVVMGQSSLVIALRPEPSLSQHAQQQQQQQQTVIVPGASEAGQKIGRVLIQSTQEDSEILVDGMFVGNTPATLVLAAGVHVLEVKKAGFRTYRKEVRVLADSEVTLKATLEK